MQPTRPAIDASTKITLRPAALEDAPALARLSGQLGYPSSFEQVTRRLSQMLEQPGQAVLVAELPQPGESGRVVGWVHGFVQRTVESDATIEIGGLVVDEYQRGLGIGRLLMDEVERWARGAGCGTITVRSNVIRDRAHAFYQRLGFSAVKSQRVFRKAIAE